MKHPLRTDQTQDSTMSRGNLTQENDDIIEALTAFATAIEQYLPILRRVIEIRAHQGSGGARAFSNTEDMASSTTPGAVGLVPAKAAAHRLTSRQQEILDLVVAGLTNRAIARKLGISERTVKNHLNTIFRRLDVVGRTQAALRAVGYEKESGVSQRPG